MIKLTSLLYGASVTPSAPKRTTTTNGVFSSNAHVILTEVKFPEFGNHCIDIVFADVFDSPTCRCDLIIGRDILKKMEATIDFQNQTIHWLGQDLLLRDPREVSLDASSRVPQLESHLQEEEGDLLLFESYAEDILFKDQKYQAALPEEVVKQFNHLSSQQNMQRLQVVFEKYKQVFDGKLY